MKTVGQLMTGPVVTVAPSDTVAVAVQRVREHQIECVVVLDAGRVAGIATLKDLIGHPPYRPIREIMTRQVYTIAPDEPVTTAFALMETYGVGRMPVLDDERLVGIVTRSNLLRELGKLTDPLTDLPWAGALRQVAADLLKQGQEIAVIFIDLDEFGIVNKLYGHVVGDHMIKAVAALLQERMEAGVDFLSRYAGDEFAIVTTRDLTDTEARAGEMREAIGRVAVPGAPAGVISTSIGVAGGKRTTERADVHYQATVDDLITMASRASTMAKRTERHVFQSSPPTVSPATVSPTTVSPAATVPVATAAQPRRMPRRVAIRRVDFVVTDGRGTAAVDLEHEGRIVSGRAEGPVLGMGTMRLLAEATLGAVRQLLPRGLDLALEGIARAQLGASEALNIMLISGSAAQEERLLGSAMFAADPHEAAVKATLDAINRLLARVLPVPA